MSNDNNEKDSYVYMQLNPRDVKGLNMNLSLKIKFKNNDSYLTPDYCKNNFILEDVVLVPEFWNFDTEEDLDNFIKKIKRG